MAIGVGLLLLGAAAYLAPRASSTWDFATFYYAALAFRRGLDPYDLGVLTRLAGGMELSPFLYAPATLAAFVPFTQLPLGAAMHLWLALKALLAAALVLLWWRAFLRGTGLFSVAAVALYGFSAALLMDLATGNISIIEELLLWLAFREYVEDRRWRFALLVAVASVFKLFPIAFVALLLVPSKRHGRGVGPALAGIGLFAGLLLVSPGRAIRWGQALSASASLQRPAGEVNPCALGVFDTLLSRRGWTGAGASALGLGLWGAYGVGLLIASRRALRRARASREPLQWVAVACMLYALLSPRMMIYSWILPIVPALLLLRSLTGATPLWAVVILTFQGFVLRAVLRADYVQNVVRLPLPADLVLSNLPFLLCLALWLVFVNGDGWRRPGKLVGQVGVEPTGGVSLTGF